MPTLIERVDADFKEAMKAKDELRLSVLRMVRTALKNKQIDTPQPLTDEESQAVLRTMIKQYQDAISDFQNAGRQDLVEKQQKEIDLITAYLPPALPREEVERIAKEAIAASGATDVGKAMGVAMKALGGQADGNVVRAIVQQILSK